MVTIHDDAGVGPMPFTVIAQRMVGSCYMFGRGQDIDIMMLVRGDLFEHHDNLKERGWRTPTPEFYSMDEDNWFSAKRGVYNLLVTTSEEHYEAMAKGSDVCKALADAGKLDPADKDMRILIHRVMTGELVVYK
jgi:hypothetical protein